MNILVVKNYEEMSKKAAHLIVGQILQNPKSILGLATGSTPVGLYTELLRFYEEGLITFDAIQVFNLDEYIGLGSDHPQSYAHFMKEILYDHIDLPEHQHHIPNGTSGDSVAECLAYENKIAEAGGIDFQILGIGRNGHIGFNEPDIKFEAKTHIVKLDVQTIEDNARFFASPEEVPKQAISMGIKTIMQSRNIVLLASGASKAEAVKGMISGKITPDLPASVLQLHPSVTFIVDEAAASLLTVGERK